MARRATWKFRKPTEDDIRFVAANMRRDDRREMIRNSGQDPEWGLRQSVTVSDVAYAAEIQCGQVACIFGATRVNLVEPTAVLWSLSTTVVDRHPIEFALGSKDGLDRIFREMPDMQEFVNYMDMDYRAAVRWIEWLGASFAINSTRNGLAGGVFKQFYLVNPYYKEK